MTPKETSIATLTMHDVATMGARERKKIANWLRHAADLVETEGKKFSKRFTERYRKVSKPA